jgi:hypothetical protein
MVTFISVSLVFRATDAVRKVVVAATPFEAAAEVEAIWTLL